ncbi:uncharacterized protein LOC116198755 isoform X2 [Punica granatum]|uniref:Uncharacterized protein n=2 Tax=Punica granatum TaxID=22663 RepID=A0A218X7I3_PUNGR|nr:uncharacterized protein LOC116198755 isoform X2 [Punica granatum]OWM80924.1 hypothetical protein CDL15_Pgr006955 [Punica granatum]PKI45656.1 hypothetical protein CRG98_033972 [Punica granatum]
MAQLIRPLRQWPPRFQHYRYRSSSPLNHLHVLLSSHTALSPTETGCNRQRFASTVPSALRRSRALRLPKAPAPYEFRESDSSSDSDDDPSRKSRNQKKREARRAVLWGMDLASFSAPQIKLILRAASLEEEVFEALMLVKRLGRDVREGKRRQFSYIGKLLREAEPELLDALIQATKDGDQSRLQALSGTEVAVDEDDSEEDIYEEEYEEEDEESLEYVRIATRWFDGLVNRDVGITNEVYSIQSIDFERQELRKLVRKVHSIQEQQASVDNDEGGAELIGAEKSLSRFLRTLAKRMPIAEI